MRWIGLNRPRFPVWGPSSSYGSAMEMVLPVLTNPAAAITISGVTRLRVPRSSSGPQRPQLLCFEPSSLTVSILGVTFLFSTLRFCSMHDI